MLDGTKVKGNITTNHTMQLVTYLERAHVASAAFRREFDRVLGAANPFQCVVGDWYESHCRKSMIPNQLLSSSI